MKTVIEWEEIILDVNDLASGELEQIQNFELYMKDYSLEWSEMVFKRESSQ